MTDVPRRPWYRKPLLVCSLLVLLVATIPAPILWHSYRAAQEVARARAETDALDPGWRLVDMEAVRPTVPDAENIALVLEEAGQKMRDRNPVPRRAGATFPAHAIGEALAMTPIGRLLPQPARDYLQQDVLSVEPALIVARRLAGLSRSRSPASLEVLMTRGLPQEQNEVLTMLAYDTLWRGQAGDVEGALLSCRAGVRGASVYCECLNDYALGYYLSIRGLITGFGLLALNLGQASEPTLAGLQQTLQEADAALLWHEMIRGERAKQDLLLEQLANDPLPGAVSVQATISRWIGVFKEMQAGELPRAVHPTMLRVLNEFSMLAARPLQEQRAVLQPLATRVQTSEPRRVQMVVSTLLSRLDDYLRMKTQLRQFIVLLALERYRLAEGRWPDSLEQLTPRFLPEIPSNVLGTGPMTYTRFDRGVRISITVPAQVQGKVTIPAQAMDRELLDDSQRGLPAQP